MDAVEYTWVNVWCMLDKILPYYCRSALLLHTLDKLVRDTKYDTICLSLVSGTNLPEGCYTVKTCLCFLG